MKSYPPAQWWLAVALAVLAGYVDAVGFLRLGGFFVSFMTGNTTRLGVGLVTASPAVAIGSGLIGAFVCGVVAGALAGHRAGDRRPVIVLLLVAVLLALAAACDRLAPRWITPLLLAAAMGCENNAFAQGGEVSVGVTYMTGTLVKIGQNVAAALLGGPRWNWLPYLLLWGGLLTGTIVGAATYAWSAGDDIAIAAGAAILLAGLCTRMEPFARRRA